MKKQTNIRLLIKPFYAAPLKDDGISAVNQLRDKIGVDFGNTKHLVTGSISAVALTYYNGTALQLSPDRDNIYLFVGSGLTIEPAWRITDILHELNRKNTTLNITANEIVEMIQSGCLTVKFNVRRTDHGTRWQIDKVLLKQQLRLLRRPAKHKRHRTQTQMAIL